MREFVAKRSQPVRPVVELGVLLFIALFAVEFLLTALAEKPYPALSGPGFAGRPARGGSVSAVSCNVQIDCSSGQVERPCTEFAQGASRVRSQVILDRLFPSDCGPREPKRGFKGRVQKLLGLPRDLRRCEPTSERLEAWLRSNAGALCSDPERLVVTRESVRFAPGTGKRSSTPLSRSEVELGR